MVAYAIVTMSRKKVIGLLASGRAAAWHEESVPGLLNMESQRKGEVGGCAVG